MVKNDGFCRLLRLSAIVGQPLAFSNIMLHVHMSSKLSLMLQMTLIKRRDSLDTINKATSKN